MKKPTLTIERLKQAYLYMPETGEFLRLQETNSFGGKAKVGSVAGARNANGYLRIGIDRKLYWAHRLAWFYMTGEWPKRDIDHIDLDKSNNRWSNLREATKSQNQANTQKRSDNTSGFKGVCKTASGTWQAVIWVKKQKLCLGTFPTAQEAFAVYQTAAEEYFGKYHRKS